MTEAFLRRQMDPLLRSAGIGGRSFGRGPILQVGEDQNMDRYHGRHAECTQVVRDAEINLIDVILVRATARAGAHLTDGLPLQAARRVLRRAVQRGWAQM